MAKEAETLLTYVEELLAKAAKEEDKSGTLGEAAKSANDALAMYKSAGDAKGEATALSSVALVAAADGKPADGVAMAEKAAVIFEEVGEPKLQAKELSTMSKMYLELDNPRKALYYAQEALELMTSEDASSDAQVGTLSLIVKSYIAKNQMSAALDEANSALARFSASGDTKAETEANSILFDAHYAAGNVSEALIALESAIDGYKAAGDAGKESTLLATSSKLCLDEGDYVKAQSQAVRAMALAKDSENWTEMLSALECCVKAALASSDGKTAVNQAIDAREVFEKAGLQKMEASACLLLCDAHTANKKYDKAGTAAKAAQEISYALEDEKGEATALDAQASVFMMEGNRFDKAFRVAEQARRIWKGLENPFQEANALNVVAQSQFNMTMEKEKSGARTSPNDWDKAMKASQEAQKLAVELGGEPGAGILLANALCTACEIHIVKKEGKEAMAAANEAVGLFLDADEEASGAYAWLLCAQAGIVLEDYHQAQEDAGEGQTIYQSLKDEQGETFAKNILDLIEQLAPPPPPAFALPPGWENMQMGAMPMPSAAKMPMAAAGPAPEAAGGGGGGGAVARTGGTGDKLNISGGISVEIVSKKIQEVAMGIIGDGEPIEEDTPLMQAGLTSNTAVLLRDELSGDIPGVNFPPTLIFDYPSIGAIAEYVMEKAG